MRAPRTAEGGRSNIVVWDTHDAPPRKAFNFYRDALCSVYMPWIAVSDDETEFYGRFETSAVGGGTISRNRCSPMVCIRNKTQVSRSENECFYVLYVLSGYHACEQNGRRNSAGPGQIIIVDSGQPCRVETGSPPYDVICITVPKADLRGIMDLEDKLANTLVKPTPAALPLLSCTNTISQQLTSYSQGELSAFYEACVSLLPLAAGCFNDEHKEKLSSPRANLLMRELREFADQNLADPGLSPRKAAHHFGVSVRYVHKLFACWGTTFNAYVAAARLNNVRKDLQSLPSNRQKISKLAFRWGFNDLSSFNRSFKQHFGCSPSRFRKTKDE